MDGGFSMEADFARVYVNRELMVGIVRMVGRGGKRNEKHYRLIDHR